jgi:hypothetical protein
MTSILEDPNKKETKKPELSTMEQITTRGDGKMEKGEDFLRDNIDFENALKHLKIHHGGEIAGSVFNSEIVKSPEEVKRLCAELLPEKLNYDQYGRAEITLELGGMEKPLGFSGISKIEDIKKKFPEVKIKKEVRISGGTLDSEAGIAGAWYPETTRDENGNFVPLADAEGNIKNPKGKFEPEANIAYVPKSLAEKTMATNKVTLIIEKEKESGKPVVRTIFPGENAPAYPCKINTENFKLDTLHSKEADFWENNVFIKQSQNSETEKGEKKEVLEILQAKDAKESSEKAEKILEGLSGKKIEKINQEQLEKLKSQASEVTRKLDAWYSETSGYAPAHYLQSSLEEFISGAFEDSDTDLTEEEKERVSDLMNLEEDPLADDWMETNTKTGNIIIADIKIPYKETDKGDAENGDDVYAELTPDPEEPSQRAEFTKIIETALESIAKELNK